MAKKLLILGSGANLEHAVQIANDLQNLEVESLELFASDRFNYEIPDLTAYHPNEWDLFVALDDRALNISRHQVVAKVKASGYQLQRLVSVDAMVSQSVSLGENSMVQKGAIIGALTKLGLNVFVGFGARIGEGCAIGSAAYMDAGCVIGRGAKLGDYTSVGMGAVVQDEAMVGRSCELRRPIIYTGSIPDRTFYLDIFQNPVSIISAI